MLEHSCYQLLAEGCQPPCLPLHRWHSEKLLWSSYREWLEGERKIEPVSGDLVPHFSGLIYTCKGDPDVWGPSSVLADPELPWQPGNSESLGFTCSTLKGVGRMYQNSNKTPCPHHQSISLNANIPTRANHKLKQMRSGKNTKSSESKKSAENKAIWADKDQGQERLQVSPSSTATILLLLVPDKFLPFRDNIKGPAHQRDPQEKMIPEDYSWNHSSNDLEGPCPLNRFAGLPVTTTWHFRIMLETAWREQKCSGHQ